MLNSKLLFFVILLSISSKIYAFGNPIEDKQILVCGMMQGQDTLIEGEIDTTFQLLESKHIGYSSFSLSKDNQEFNISFDNDGKYQIKFKDKAGKEYKSKQNELMNLSMLKDLEQNFTTRGSVDSNLKLDYFCKKVRFGDYNHLNAINDSSKGKVKEAERTNVIKDNSSTGVSK